MKSEHRKGKSAKQLIAENIALIVKIQREADGERTFGERIADTVAHSIGSWPFILIQSFILTIWIILNVCGAFKAWDPYPFILLNLALSFQAAYASPIIMMSQNRQSKVSDQRNHLALQIAMLAEQEDTETLQLIHKICEKLDIPIEKRAKALEAATDPELLHRQIEKMEKEAKKK